MWRKLRLTVLGRVIRMRVWFPVRGEASRAKNKLEGGRAAGLLRSRICEGKYLIHMCLVPLVCWLQWLFYKMYLIVLKLQCGFRVMLMCYRIMLKNNNTVVFIHDELLLIFGKILIYMSWFIWDFDYMNHKIY